MGINTMIRNHRLSASALTPIPDVLRPLVEIPHIQQMTFPKEQVLVYEGHIAPGCFVFWDGVLLQHSELFGERRTLWVRQVDDLEETQEPDFGMGADHSVLQQHLWVFPERAQLPLALPFTVSTLRHTSALFIPRSIMSQSHILDILHRLVCQS